MKKIKLYNGEIIPVIWQGCAQINNVCTDEQLAVWKTAIELGSNCFDTAELYGRGKSEILIGKLLKKINRNDVFISTKVSPENCTFDKILDSCNNSLDRLKTDYIDLYHIHWTNPNVSLQEMANSMKLLYNKNKIRHIGICNFTLNQIKEFINYLEEIPLSAVQMEYNVTNRMCENGIIPFCQENNILFQAYTPLNSGKISNDLLKDLSKKYNKTTNQIILNWLTRNDNTCALPKTSNVEHLKENCSSTDFIIEPYDIELINVEFLYKVYKIKCSDITLLYTGVECSNDIYTTIEDALENKFNCIPSPEDLSKEFKYIKELSRPVYIKIENDKKFLVSGNVRYWAWVIAFGFNEKIDCIII